MADSVLLIRHEAAAKQTKAQLKRAGFASHILSLSKINPTGAQIPKGRFQALICTSAQTISTLSALDKELVDQLRALPIYCVGQNTQSAARLAGFSSIAGTAPDAATLAADICGRSDLTEFLYPCATDLAFDMEKFLSSDAKNCVAWPIYENELLTPAPPRLEQALDKSRAVLLFSRRTAEHFFNLIKQQHLAEELEKITIVAISQNVADIVPAICSSNLHIADNKSVDAMIECL